MEINKNWWYLYNQSDKTIRVKVLEVKEILATVTLRNNSDSKYVTSVNISDLKVPEIDELSTKFDNGNYDIWFVKDNLGSIEIRTGTKGDSLITSFDAFGLNATDKFSKFMIDLTDSCNTLMIEKSQWICLKGRC